MYEIIKNLINSKDYELKDILYKINKMYLESVLTEEQKTELDSLARQNAVAENSYNIQRQFDEIFKRLEKLEEFHKTEESINPEEYPEYKEPTGAHDAYKTGDKITYNGKKYICKIDGCVWSPDVYPDALEEVVESED